MDEVRSCHKEYESQGQKPIILHCRYVPWVRAPSLSWYTVTWHSGLLFLLLSAGVGRTGAFAVIYSAIREFSATGYICKNDVYFMRTWVRACACACVSVSSIIHMITTALTYIVYVPLLWCNSIFSEHLSSGQDAEAKTQVDGAEESESSVTAYYIMTKRLWLLVILSIVWNTYPKTIHKFAKKKNWPKKIGNVGTGRVQRRASKGHHESKSLTVRLFVFRSSTNFATGRSCFTLVSTLPWVSCNSNVYVVLHSTFQTIFIAYGIKYKSIK